jgi:hypothetical protein
VGSPITIPDNGWRVIKIDGSLGGGDITFQTCGNEKDTIFLDVPDPANPFNPYTVSGPTQFRIYLGAGIMLRATLSGSTGAANVFVRIF